MSDPAPGSENSWHQRSSPVAIGGRKRRLVSSLAHSRIARRGEVQPRPAGQPGHVPRRRVGPRRSGLRRSTCPATTERDRPVRGDPSGGAESGDRRPPVERRGIGRLVAAGRGDLLLPVLGQQAVEQVDEFVTPRGRRRARSQRDGCGHLRLSGWRVGPGSGRRRSGRRPRRASSAPRRRICSPRVGGACGSDSPTGGSIGEGRSPVICIGPRGARGSGLRIAFQSACVYGCCVVVVQQLGRPDLAQLAHVHDGDPVARVA